jgi:hypothetical protein
VQRTKRNCVFRIAEASLMQSAPLNLLILLNLDFFLLRLPRCARRRERVRIASKAKPNAREMRVTPGDQNFAGPMKKGRPKAERPKSREETPKVGKAIAKSVSAQPQHEDALLR